MLGISAGAMLMSKYIATIPCSEEYPDFRIENGLNLDELSIFPHNNVSSVEYPDKLVSGCETYKKSDLITLSMLFMRKFTFLGGIFPPVGTLLTTIPQAVLGGCTIMMFGSILFAGFGMMAKSGFSQRNMIIVSLSLSVGLGFTQAAGMFKEFPQIFQTIFAENCVAVVFLLAVILNLVLPKEKEEKTAGK